MNTIAILTTFLLGGAFGIAGASARLWWRMYHVRTAEAALLRRKIEFEARRVNWARRRAATS